METIVRNKDILFHYVFNHDMKTTWNVIRDLEKTNRMTNLIINEIFSKINFTKYDKSYEKGAEFDMIWKNMMRIYMRTTEIEETDSYCCIKWNIYKTEPNLMAYDIIYKLYAEENDLKCSFVMNVIFEKIYERSKFVQDKEIEEKQIMYRNIDQCIEEEKKCKIQTESIRIKSGIDTIWDLISNLKRLQNFIPQICDRVEYDEEKLRVDLKVLFEWEKNNKIKVFLIVKFILEESNFKKLILESYYSKPTVPSQEIEWSISKDNDECIIQFTHRYKEIVNKDSLAYMSKMKKNILKNLKDLIEENDVN